MTHIDPGAPNGGTGDEKGRMSQPDDPGAHEDKASGGSSSGPHEGGGGSGMGGAHQAGPGGDTSNPDEFLGVEKDFWIRLLFMIAAGFVAWVSFWFIIILAVAQTIYRLAAGHANEDLRGFTRNMIQYLRDLLGFATLVRDERPFLFGGKFPDQKSGEF